MKSTKVHNLISISAALRACIIKLFAARAKRARDDTILINLITAYAKLLEYYL